LDQLISYCSRAVLDGAFSTLSGYQRWFAGGLLLAAVLLLGLFLRFSNPDLVDRGPLNSLVLMPLGQSYRASCTTPGAYEKQVVVTKSILLLALNDQDASLAASEYLGDCELSVLELYWHWGRRRHWTDYDRYEPNRVGTAITSELGYKSGHRRWFQVRIPEADEYRGLVLPP
jgi:hypothetical protein